MRWISERDLAPGGTEAGMDCVRLFCLPHAGSGAAAFYRWKRMLPEWIRVCPVLLPGRERRLQEDPLGSVEELVLGVHGDVAEALRDGTPYAIFAHSMGTLVGFEWGRTIEAEGLPRPLCLFASGRNAPQIPIVHRGLHRMSDEAFVHELETRYGGLPEGFLEDSELREVYLPILRADVKVVEMYRFAEGAGLRCPVRGWAGRDDPSVSEAGLEAWEDLTSGGFAARMFAGDHFYHAGLGQQEMLGELVRTLERLRDERAGRPSR